MTEKVTFLRRDEPAIPLINFAAPEDLADWYAGGLLLSLERGERRLAITCFDAQAVFGFHPGRTAQAVLEAVMKVLYEHPEAESLTVVCGDEATWKAYRFCWNLWYAERKPEHGA